MSTRSAAVPEVPVASQLIPETQLPPSNVGTVPLPNTPANPPSFPDFANFLWLSFSVHQQINSERGSSEYTTYGGITVSSCGMPDDEVREFHSYRHSFPHVPQLLYPLTRPDGLSGQFLHLTQIPFGVEIDTNTRLS